VECGCCREQLLFLDAFVHPDDAEARRGFESSSSDIVEFKGIRRKVIRKGGREEEEGE
jgi:hypothetical protein